jgi:hypothetical protein
VESERKSGFDEYTRDTFERIDHRNKESDAVYVKKVSVAEGDTHVLCLSEGRARKELAMDGQAEQRFLEAMERLQERQSRIAQHYDVEIQYNETEQRVVDLIWTKKFNFICFCDKSVDDSRATPVNCHFAKVGSILFDVYTYSNI